MNLCKLLKNHIDKIFYSPMCGYCELTSVGEKSFTCKDYDNNTHMFNEYGHYCVGRNITSEEMMLFPQKHDTDWEAWERQQQTLNVNTWSDLEKNIPK